MCTASWWLGGGQSALCFNRDERKSRPRAGKPELFLNEGVRCLVPFDPQGGGSWICVSERGLCAFLLNNYEAGNATDGPGTSAKSRGTLPLKACSFRDRSEAARWIRSEDLSRFRPFFIGLLDRDGCEVHGWDGYRLEKLPETLDFLTTSSYRSQEVQVYRKDRYEGWRKESRELGDLETRLCYHLNVDHADSAFNPLMRRAESETHNVSAVRIGPESVEFVFLERGMESDAFAPRYEARLACS